MMSENEKSEYDENKEKVTKPREILHNTIRTARRNASCSHGWLRLTVQCIFGAVTIASFVMIFYMSVSSSRTKEVSSRCRTYTCRVFCTNIAFTDTQVEDLFNSVKVVETNCAQVVLSLYEPFFVNTTIPPYWLSSFSSNVNDLEIIGGNMKYIASNAFMTLFGANIRRLVFDSVIIADWEPQSLIGLIKLRSLSIRSSHILKIRSYALEAFDDTLNRLDVTESGYWNPTNLTGQTKVMNITSVFLSNNNFNNILNKNSFAGLQKCRVLYLNSCRITTLAEGTFDYLEEIETLFLNDNFLVIVPSNLFKTILSIESHQPRINLQNNFWYCDCDTSAIIQNLLSSGALIMEPTCFYPAIVRDQKFSRFVETCNNSSTDRIITSLDDSIIDDISFKENCKDNRGLSVFISSTNVLSCTTIQQEFFHKTFINNPALSNRTSKKPHSNELLKIRFAMESESFSLLEITSPSYLSNGEYGLLWYQTACPEKLYCVNRLPNFLRVYNVESDSEYSFCPINLESGMVDPDKCVFNSLYTAFERNEIAKVLRILSYILTTIVCTIIGASIVYTVIRKFPYLLKGSDRILFVKHKNVDALVLPPKVPLRDNAVQDSAICNDIFTLTDTNLPRNYFVRKSTRSNKSIAPSYISAMQPTEEQLSEWRLRQHFDNNATLTSTGIPYLFVTDDESMYCSLDQTNSNAYESLKTGST